MKEYHSQQTYMGSFSFKKGGNQMNRWLTIIFSLAALFTAAAPVAAQAINLTGDWEIILKTPQGDFPVKVTIKQEGEKLSGLARGPLGVRSAPVQGTIQGREVKAGCLIRMDNNDIQITLTGEVDGDSIKGKADFGGFAEGVWTAKRLSGDAIAGTSKAPVNDAPSGEKIDVSGAWSFEVETASGSSHPTFTFKQEGETLTGQFKGAFGEAPLTGTVKGNEITFSFKVQSQNGEVTVTYTGTVEKNLMKGAAQFGELVSGAWTAKRQ